MAVGFDFFGRNLGLVPQLFEFRMPVDGVVVDDHLDIEGKKIARLGNCQRIDFDQTGVIFEKRLIDSGHGRCDGVRRLARKAQIGSQRLGVGVVETGFGVDHQFVDFIGRRGGGFLDILAAFTGGQEGDAANRSIDQGGQVNFLGHFTGLFHVNPFDLYAQRAGLRRHQPGAQHTGGSFARGLGGFYDLDATGSAAAAGMDLGLDHPGGSAKGGGGLVRLVRRGGGDPRRYRHAVCLQQLLGLIFMQVH